MFKYFIELKEGKNGSFHKSNGVELVGISKAKNEVIKFFSEEPYKKKLKEGYDTLLEYTSKVEDASGGATINTTMWVGKCYSCIPSLAVLVSNISVLYKDGYPVVNGICISEDDKNVHVDILSRNIDDELTMEYSFSKETDEGYMKFDGGELSSEALRNVMVDVLGITKTSMKSLRILSVDNKDLKDCNFDDMFLFVMEVDGSGESDETKERCVEIYLV